MKIEVDSTPISYRPVNWELPKIDYTPKFITVVRADRYACCSCGDDDEETSCGSCLEYIRECFCCLITSLRDLVCMLPCLQCFREQPDAHEQQFVQYWKNPTEQDAAKIAAKWRADYEALNWAAQVAARNAFQGAHPEYADQIPKRLGFRSLEENMLQDGEIRMAIDKLIIAHPCDPNVITAVEDLLKN